MLIMATLVNSSTQTKECELLDNLKSSTPRVVIDTSPPFASVEEAVMRFGGRGFWIPRRHFVPPDAPPQYQLHDPKKPDTYKLKDQTTAMLNDLQMKEHQTRDILKELESIKRLVEELKTKLPKDAPESIQSPYVASHKNHIVNDHMSLQSMKLEQLNSFPTSTAELIMKELKQTKLQLYQNTCDLAAIRASVESLSEKIEKEKEQVDANFNELDNLGGSVNPLLISKELRELNYEAEQFMRTAELARSEVLKAMADVEQTKTGLKVIEMRWVAAKKLEEAARAAESLALAEIRALSTNDNVEKNGRISLSLEEYSALTDQARRAKNLFEKKDQNGAEEKLSKTSLEEAVNRVEVINKRQVFDDEAFRKLGSDPNSRGSFGSTNSEFRKRRDPRLLEPHEFEFMKNKSKPVLRPTTTSIGNILSRKLVLKDDIDVGRQRVSLNQMLSKHRGEIPPLNKREKEGGGENKNNFFSKRKGFGFVHISLPLTKPSKNKIQALNLW